MPSAEAPSWFLALKSYVPLSPSRSMFSSASRTLPFSVVPASRIASTSSVSASAA
jgi:hypothetical protein